MKIERFNTNPLISQGMDPQMGANINGPSVIRVPDWLPKPMGRYYMYFAHHQGTYIRLAYADFLEGPWTVYTPGTLDLEGTPFVAHIASPDVHIDHDTKRLRMYFHGPLPEKKVGHTVSEVQQATAVAFSEDGVAFKPEPEILGNPYMRVVRHGDYYYGLGMPGRLYRSRNGIDRFEKGPMILPPKTRHNAILPLPPADGSPGEWTDPDSLADNWLVVYTHYEDTPERLIAMRVDLAEDWMEWTAGEPEILLEPDLDYEGGDLPVTQAKMGWAPERVRQLRDPGFYCEEGQVYLFYSIAGEDGIAGVRLQL